MITELSFVEQQITFPLAFPHIATKFHTPPPPATLLKRPRLKQQLNQCIQKRLGLVSAPAGFGKTTLLSEWSHSGEWPIAWVSLDETDNDPIHFWSYIAVAFSKLDENIEQFLPLLHSCNPDITFILTGLINAIANIADHFALVLDDYHLINCPDVHHTLAFFIDHLPAQGHIILSTRTPPPLPLARWRVQGHLLEIRADDLRFAENETETLLTQVLRHNLSPQDVSTLHSRTEGWAAGLHLASLLIENPRRAVPETLQSFSGDHRYIVDYLAAEVFQQQPEVIRNFLLQTAILDDLPAELCDAVIGQSDSRSILSQLEAHNLFIVPVDCSYRTYRYHHLFTDFLRNRLSQTPDFDSATLHRRAATWYETAGNIDRAIKHTLAAGQIDEATRLIEKITMSRLMRGELNTVRRWLEALPDEVVRQNPLFCICNAWISTHAGQTEQAEDYLKTVAQFDPAIAQSWIGRMEVVRTRMAHVQGNVEQTAKHSEYALTHLAENDLVWRAEVIFDQTYTYQVLRQFEKSRQAYRQAISVSEKTGNTRAAMLARYYLGKMLMDMGEFQQAARNYQQGIAWCEKSNPPANAICWAYAGLGSLLYEWNRQGEAEAYQRKALKLAQQIGEVKVIVYAGQGLANTLFAQGKVEAAQAALDSAEAIARQSNIPALIDEVERTQIQLWLRQGKVEAAINWVQKQGRTLNYDHPDDPGNNISIWVAIAQARSSPPPADNIITLVKERVKIAGTSGQKWIQIQELISLATIYRLQDELPTAFDVFREALRLAEPMALNRTFFDNGTPAAQLIRQAVATGSASEYVSELPASISTLNTISEIEITTSTFTETEQSLVEPLKQREVEVLQHIAIGRSNQEIANEMILAVSTVKWHLKNIYQKLQVSRRTQALAKAKELNLL